MDGHVGERGKLAWAAPLATDEGRGSEVTNPKCLLPSASPTFPLPPSMQVKYSRCEFSLLEYGMLGRLCPFAVLLNLLKHAGGGLMPTSRSLCLPVL